MNAKTVLKKAKPKTKKPQQTKIKTKKEFLEILTKINRKKKRFVLRIEDGGEIREKDSDRCPIEVVGEYLKVEDADSWDYDEIAKRLEIPIKLRDAITHAADDWDPKNKFRQEILLACRLKECENPKPD